MRIKTALIPLLALTALLLPGVAVRANVISFQQGVDHGFGAYTGIKDTGIFRGFPDSVGDGAVGGQTFGNPPEVIFDVTQDFGAFALLRFENIFGGGPGKIPPGSTINSATLRMATCCDFFYDDSGDTFTASQMLIDWEPTTLTWNNAAGLAGGNGTAGIQPDGIDAKALADPSTTTAIPSGGPPVGTGFAVFIVTAMLQNWSNGDVNHGLLVSPPNPLAPADFNTNTWKAYQSEDAGHPTLRPLLTVNFEPAAIPEPSTFALALIGLLGLASLARRKRPSS